MKRFGLAIIVILTIGFFALSLTGCDNGTGGTGGPQSVTYKGNANGKNYKLKITENLNRSYKPQGDDSYLLTVDNNQSSGTVIVVDGQTYTLLPDFPGADPFDVTVNGQDGITNIDGPITFDDGEEEDGPGHVNPGMLATYIIGSTGPGGGIIFYHNPAGFDLGDGYTRYYLEVANVAFADLAWISDDFLTIVDELYNYDFDASFVPDTEFDLGLGMWNTQQILSVDPNAPAAKACTSYRGGGFDDWFLPSPREFWVMANVLIHNNYLNHPAYHKFCWSSAQNPEIKWDAIEMFFYSEPEVFNYSMAFKLDQPIYTVPIRGFANSQK